MGRATTKNIKLTESAHQRVHDHKRDGENISPCIERAFDALELVEDLPDAVEEALREQ